jgi:ABC-type phosphate transport system substrate-binding protein
MARGNPRPNVKRETSMHRLGKSLAGVAASATMLGVLGLTATAQAQPANPTVLGGDPKVPAGVETSVNLTACPSGNTVSSVTSVPALPATVIPITKANKAKLSGDWPAPPPSSYVVTLHCSGGSTKASTVSVLAHPAETAIVGVGSDTYQSVGDQFSGDYNATLKATSTAQLYNWDATNPTTGAMGDSIITKSGCSSIARPDGGSAGLTAMDANARTSDGKQFCIDFTRIARARSSSDPPFAPGGVGFVSLAEDAITYATQATTDAPSNLTTAQLAGIYNCTITNWSTVGGKSATIQPVLPQTGSALAKQFLTDIGVANAGACVNQTVQQNEGVDPLLKTPQAVVPYSVAKYIAQKFHSAHCLNSGCTPNGSGVVCTPTAGQNQFGCNLHGTLKLNSINGIAPTTGTGTGTTINTSFAATSYGNPISDVVRYDSTTPDHIPAYLERLYATASAATPGWVCSSATAKADLKHYGYLLSPLCGIPS